jgi:hypothetical protein
MTVKTNTGQLAHLVEPIINNQSIKYKIKDTTTAAESIIDIKNIDLCFKNDASIMCPMMTNAKLIKDFDNTPQTGGTRHAKPKHTKSNRTSQSKTKRNPKD